MHVSIKCLGEFLMLTSEILDLINEIEDRYPVDEWTVDGIKVWPLIRIRLNFDLFYAHHTSIVDNGTTKNQNISKCADIVKGLYSFLHASIIDFRNNSSLNSPVDVVFFNDGKSFINIHGLWYDRLCDPLIDICKTHNISYLILTPGYKYITPRRSPSKFIQFFLDSIRVSTFFKAKRGLYITHHLPGYDEFVRFITEMKIGICAPTINSLFKQIALINGYASYFGDILDKLKPATACVVCYYGIERMAFSLACRRLGIPLIDLQHGLQGDLHAAYGRWNKVPITGYDLLPSYFWCWSQYEVNTIEKWSCAVTDFHRPMLGGNTWMNIWKNPDSEMVRSYDKIVNRLKDVVPGVKWILVSLQFNLDDKDTLRPLLNAVRRSDSAWFWWIRLHPDMLHKREHIQKMFTECGNKNIELDMATDLPLYALLRHSDVQVTHSSSTVVEAEEFGVPSVIFSAYGTEFFPDQIASGWALFAGEDNVKEAIKTQLERKASYLLPVKENQQNIGEQEFIKFTRVRHNIFSRGYQFEQ